MATYHCSMSIGGGRKGGSAVSAAAYRARDKLLENVAYRTGSTAEGTYRTHDYSDKSDELFHSEIIAPKGADDRLTDRCFLWDAAHGAELTRKGVPRVGARYFRELKLSLPRELSEERQTELARAFAKAELVDRHGVVADINCHRPNAADGEPNGHVHVMYTTRAATGDGLGKKVRELDAKAHLTGLREAWAVHQNRALMQAGRGERVSHLSVEDRFHDALRRGDLPEMAKFDRDPVPHMTREELAMHRKGVVTAKGKLRDEVQEANRQRQAVYGTVQEFGTRAQQAFVFIRQTVDDARDAFSTWARNAKGWLSERFGLEERRGQRQRRASFDAWRQGRDARTAGPDDTEAKRERIARYAEQVAAASILPPADRAVLVGAAMELRRETGRQPDDLLDQAHALRLERLQEELRAEARLVEARKGIGPARDMARRQRPRDAGLWRPLTAEEAAAVGKAVRDDAADRHARRDKLEAHREKQGRRQGQEQDDDWREKFKQRQARERSQGRGGYSR